mmetsp:Transcript_6228/g.9046  ORF Transcript_6228/g.9046 Transcript_6228/m.9046 type:complete len:342 (+) Transcript_6228:48-1073(+)
MSRHGYFEDSSSSDESSDDDIVIGSSASLQFHDVFKKVQHSQDDSINVLEGKKMDEHDHDDQKMEDSLEDWDQLTDDDNDALYEEVDYTKETVKETKMAEEQDTQDYSSSLESTSSQSKLRRPFELEDEREIKKPRLESPPPTSHIQLYIQLFKPFKALKSFSFPKEDTLKMVKNQVCNVFALPVNEYMMVFNKLVLDESEHLQDFIDDGHFVDGTTLILLPDNEDPINYQENGEVKGDDNKLIIKIRRGAKDTFTVSLKPETTIDTLIEKLSKSKICESMAKDDIQLWIDGDVAFGSDTMDELGIENDDMFDLKSKLESKDPPPPTTNEPTRHEEIIIDD